MASPSVKDKGKRIRDKGKISAKSGELIAQESERKSMKVVLVANVANEDCVGDPGDKKDLPEEIAKKFLEEGWAVKDLEPEESKPEVERAVSGHRETATHPAQRKG